MLLLMKFLFFGAKSRNPIQLRIFNSNCQNTARGRDRKFRRAFFRFGMFESCYLRFPAYPGCVDGIERLPVSQGEKEIGKGKARPCSKQFVIMFVAERRSRFKTDFKKTFEVAV